ncbi:hypothetical protein NQ315_005494 [Exocentrus adspersus]|uniref:Phosphatidylethanolamine-binding protein n=1 Tax=Exocentrus adspersus TaxID=1586481 RepID=A0AAV8VSZ4_9CUCU|nr:hypothetical protein NQ315_005494 [Exocentrus adspersus]
MAAMKHLQVTRLIANHNLISTTLSKAMTTLSMSQAWLTKKVVPDVIKEVPPNKLGVQYQEITVNEGNVLKPRQAKSPPAVSWGVQDEGSLFALCMTDPDAPSRSKPSQREWHHWLVVNIPGNKVEKGETLSEYIGAGPPKDTGLHRYVFLLYAYDKKINFDEKKLSNTSGDGRANFSISKFAEKYKLGKPIAGNFFVAEFDSYVPELYKQLGLS